MKRFWYGSIGMAAITVIAAYMVGCGSHHSSNPLGPSTASTSTPTKTPIYTPNATQTIAAVVATQTAVSGLPIATQTAVAVIATTTAVVVQATQTRVSVQATQTAVAVNATLTTVAGLPTATPGPGLGSCAPVALLGTFDNTQGSNFVAIGNETACTLTFVMDGSVSQAVLSGHAFYFNTTAGNHSFTVSGCGYYATTSAAASPNFVVGWLISCNGSSYIDTATTLYTATPTPIPPTAATQTAVAAEATQTFVAGQTTLTPSATPVPATAQVLWKNGVLSSTLWGQSVAMGGGSNGASIGNPTVALSDPISGDSTVLELSLGSGPNSSAVDFGIANPVNASGYFASGHIQFDIELGAAWSSNNTINVLYGVFGATTCESVAVSGLSTSSFTHVSVPFSSDYNSCNSSTGVNGFGIGAFSLNTATVGVQFYIDNIQITPN